MTTPTTDAHDGDGFPCQCHLPQYAYTDDPCPECVRAALDGPEVRLADGNANPDEEPECCDNQYFADACGMMTQEDWDADNDWLASAGWGEM